MPALCATEGRGSFSFLPRTGTSNQLNVTGSGSVAAFEGLGDNGLVSETTLLVLKQRAKRAGQLVQLSVILAKPLSADFAATRFIQLYLNAHRVDGLQPGVYRFWPECAEVEQVQVKRRPPPYSTPQHVPGKGTRNGDSTNAVACRTCDYSSGKALKASMTTSRTLSTQRFRG